MSTQTAEAPSAPAVQPAPHVWRRRSFSWRRLPWWLELATVGGGYLLYEATRVLATPRAAPAIAHGRDILRVERWLHLDPEVALNQFLNRWDALADLAGYYYTTLHFIITPLVLIYLWWRRPQAYGRLRSALVIATVIGLVTFILWPAAPPRFTMSSLSDTLVQHHILGMSNPHGVSGLINEYAAMPSLHVGWAVWCAAAIVLTSSSRWRYLAWLYPTATTFVVLATANHYLLDAVAGATLTLAAVALTMPARRPARLPVAADLDLVLSSDDRPTVSAGRADRAEQADRAPAGGPSGPSGTVLRAGHPDAGAAIQWPSGEHLDQRRRKSCRHHARHPGGG